VFSDFGTLTDSDFKSASSVDEASIRVSIGTGLSWKSPLGPIAVDFAVPLVKESFDQLELFRFSVGTRF